MKVWWVFSVTQYYPAGGMGDFLAAFDTEEEARQFVTDENVKKYAADAYEIENISNVLTTGKF